MKTLTTLLLAACAVSAWCADLTTQYGGGTATGSVSHASFPPSKAFDDLPATDTNGRWLSVGTTGWVQYRFPGGQAYAVGSYTIWNLTLHSVTTRAVKDFHLSGSNDGTAWTVLDTRTGQTGWADAESRTYTLATPSDAYAYYRLTVTANNGASDYTGLGELELFAPVYDPPGAATAPSPTNGAVNVYPVGKLRWTTGLNSVSNHVYLGVTSELTETDLFDVTAGSELPYGLLPGLTEFHWRVDGHNPYGVTTGAVWRFTTPALPAALVAYDGFETYAAGALHGAGATGSGWEAAWSATTGVQVVEDAMSYRSGDVRVEGGGKAVRYPYFADDLRPLSRAFEPIGYGTAYFSMLAKGAGMQNDVHSFALRDSAFPAGGDGIAESAGFDFGRGGSDTGTPYLLAEISYYDNKRERVATPVAVTNDVTYFVVARLRRSPGNNEYEAVDVLVNPSSTTEPGTGWTTAANAGSSAMTLRQFILRTAVMDPGDWVQFDEVRVGTTYAAVVPKAESMTVIRVW